MQDPRHRGRRPAGPRPGGRPRRARCRPGGRRCSLYGPDGPAPSDVEVVGADHSALPVGRPGRRARARLDGAAARRDRPRRRLRPPSTPASPTPTGPSRSTPSAPGTWPRRPSAVGAHLVYVSTDYVFDGTLTRPYVEWDEPNPLSVYGRSKLGGERECPPGATIVRTSWVCGAHGRQHGQDRPAPGRGRRPAALRRRPARVAHLHRRPGGRRGHPGRRSASRALPRHQPGRDHLVRFRAGRAGRRRARPRAGRADHHRRPRPAPPGPPPGQLGARQRRPAAGRAARSCPTGRTGWSGWSAPCSRQEAMP